jgi:hypothetical protein
MFAVVELCIQLEMLEVNYFLLTGLLCLFLTAYIIGFTYYISYLSSLPTSPSKSQHPATLSKFCSLSELQLSSLIWSHRGSAQFFSSNIFSTPSTSVDDFDSSKQSISFLLSHGITNFDVDVSLQTSSPFNTTSPNFIVAHPSALENSPNLPYQTIQSLLNQISDYFPHPFSNLTTKYLYPFVTVEPKFENLDSLHQLLNEVMGTSLGSAGHVAIIVKDEVHLREVEKFYKDQSSHSQFQTHRLQPIAIAYRSQNPKGDRNYLWTRSPQNLPPQYISRDSLFVSFQQIHMPDIQLLRSTEAIESSRRARERSPLPLPFRSDGERVVSSSSDRIVCWIVDQEEVMWDVFQDSSADMIITNRPVQMLTALQKEQRNRC